MKPVTGSAFVLCVFLCTEATAAATPLERQGDQYGRAVTAATARPNAAGAPLSGVAAAAPAVPAPQPQSSPTASTEREALYWQSIVNSENPADFEAYLEQFPNGAFRVLAENRLSGFRPEQMCTGRPAVAACWMAIAEKPACYVWNSNPRSPSDSVTWTGECAGGVTQGTGTLTWVGPDGSRLSETGRLQNGRHTGHWVVRLPSGTVAEGPVVEGKEHGGWVFRFADGTVWEGPYADGEQTGQWTLRFADGTVEAGSLVDGERNGHWVITLADGGVQAGRFVGDERTGPWVLRFASGVVEEGPFVGGERNGRWVISFTDRRVHEGAFVDGRRNGRWILRGPGERVTTRLYADGEVVSPSHR